VQIDGTVFQSIGWSAFGNWATPFMPTFAGEVAHPGSDFPGTAGSPTYFNSIDTQSWDNDQCYPACYDVRLTYAGPALQKGSSTSDGCSWVSAWNNNPNIGY
jgi:hypothetical protein